MEIAITGQADKRVKPELATVYLSVSAKGRDRQRVLDDARRRTNQLIKDLEGIPDDVLDRFSTDGVRTYSYRPWDGKLRKPTVHTADASVRATFKDFSAMAEYTSRWADAEFEVGRTLWDLTDETREKVMQELMAEVLDSARTKAEHIARHLGFGSVSPVRVTDQRGDTRAPVPAAAPMSFMSRSAGGEAPVEARPEDIELSSSLIVVFEAS